MKLKSDLDWIKCLRDYSKHLIGQYETDEKDKTLIEEHDAFDKNVLKSFTKNRAFKTRHKLKAHTSKIVSSFKTPSISCSLVKDYKVS